MKYRLATAFAAIAFAVPAAAQAPGERSAVRDVSCDYDCLIGMVEAHMDALGARDPSRLPLAGDVLFTENNVPLEVGEGLWAIADDVDEKGLVVADETTGHAAWFGSVRENGTAVFYAVRIHVEDRLIDEIESVVHRRTSLPAPYGDWENMVHFPEFAEVLPEEERRPRERMLAIADSYFDTVELNDGQVFAPFADDCARLENGILTTAVREGEQQSAAAIAAGCEAQFRLGIYKINKRIRRQLPLVDVERGVVLGAGFFDHANEFDRYLLTNGREMNTALKWPNSISLLEAFRIRNGAIQRIETVFTYVPYFMHNPFWGPDSEMPVFAADPAVCRKACLDTLARSAVNRMVSNDWRNIDWADRVGYAENSVGIRVGEGIWATVTAVDQSPLVVADADTGKAVWIGRIEEHGQPAWAAFTVSADGTQVGSIDAVIRRKEYGPPYAEPVSATDFSEIPNSSATSRDAMAAMATAFAHAIETNGPAPQGMASGCSWKVNGQDVGGCAASFGSAALARVEEVRDRELLAMDVFRGLAVYRFFEDIPATEGGYPLTYQVIELYRFEDRELTAVEAFTSELPYGMQPLSQR